MRTDMRVEPVALGSGEEGLRGYCWGAREDDAGEGVQGAMLGAREKRTDSVALGKHFPSVGRNRMGIMSAPTPQG